VYNSILFCLFGVTSSLAVIHTIYCLSWLFIVQERAWSVSRCRTTATVTCYRAWRLVVEYPQYTTSDISVITCRTVALVHRRPCWQHMACCSVNSRHWSHNRLRIAISAYPPAFDAPSGGSRRNIAIPFGMEKLKWCGYPTVKTFRRYLYRMYERDRHTDRQTHTPHDGIGRACIASRGKNQLCSEAQNFKAKSKFFKHTAIAEIKICSRSIRLTASQNR